ncbi:hypothetical protein ABEB36_006692 [Hypothenemus hampei]|uniref:Methyltransferase-like 26 n=1 Tax=Hypothenemus hampei TaxID=57062 RepID=A0ABD1ERF5_HYPHA
MGEFSRTLTYPAAERNKTFILEVLRKYIQANVPTTLLEISSGSGQHASFVATNFPQMIVQPSEVDHKLFDSIKGYAKQVPGGNMKEPLWIDVERGPWSVSKGYDYLLNVNMFHITPYSCTKSFFKYGSEILKSQGLIFSYGPYAQNGIIEPQSNIDFDRNLKQMNPEFGLRDIKDIEKEALLYGVHLRKIFDLPANNKCLVWQKSEN